MKFTVNAEQFREAVRSVKHHPSRRPTLIVEARGKSVVEVNAWEFDLWVAVKAPEAEVTEPGRIALDYRTASRAISALPGNRFECSLVESGESKALALVTDEGTEMHVATPPAYQPTEQFSAPPSAVEVPLHVGALAEVARFASTDDCRPVLCTVQVEGDTYAATDSYRLATVKVPEFEVDREEFLLPRQSIEAMERLCGPKAVKARVNGSAAIIEHGDVRLWTRLIEGKFPNWRTLVPEESKQTNTIEVEGIYEVARKLWRLTRALSVGNYGEPLKVSGNNEQAVVEAAKLPTTLAELRIGDAFRVFNENMVLVVDDIDWHQVSGPSHNDQGTYPNDSIKVWKCYPIGERGEYERSETLRKFGTDARVKRYGGRVIRDIVFMGRVELTAKVV